MFGAAQRRSNAAAIASAWRCSRSRTASARNELWRRRSASSGWCCVPFVLLLVATAASFAIALRSWWRRVIRYTARDVRLATRSFSSGTLAI